MVGQCIDKIISSCNRVRQFLHSLMLFFEFRFSHESTQAHSSLMTEFWNFYLFIVTIEPIFKLLRCNWQIVKLEFIAQIKHLFWRRSQVDSKKISVSYGGHLLSVDKISSILRFVLKATSSRFVTAANLFHFLFSVWASFIF